MNDSFYYLRRWKAVPIALAMLPMTSPNNNVNETDKNLHIYKLYPYGQSAFTEYSDEGNPTFI